MRGQFGPVGRIGQQVGQPRDRDRRDAVLGGQLLGRRERALAALLAIQRDQHAGGRRAGARGSAPAIRGSRCRR